MHTSSSLFSYESSASNNIVAFVLALFIHVFLFLLLFIGLQWHSQTPSGLEAEIWTDIPPVIATRLPPESPHTLQPQITEKEVDIATNQQHPKEVKKTPTPKQTDSTPLTKNHKLPQQNVAENKKSPAITENASQRLQKINAEQARATELARLRQFATEAGSGGNQGTASGTDTPGLALYREKVRKRVKPNIIFIADSITGNPSAIVQIELAPNGEILRRQLIKNSGNTAWDTAVLRALDRSSPLPLDDSGQVPSRFTITFRPRD